MKYHDGDLVGPNKILLVKRTKRIEKNYYGLFKCPFCGKNFESQIGKISAGRIKSCGCHQYIGKKSSSLIDLTGKKFGRLKVISRNEDSFKDKQVRWNCECDCGNKTIVRGSLLRKGATTSCGCFQKEKAQEIGKKNSKNLMGLRFGRLTVIEKTEKRRKDHSIYWKCLCDCGQETYVTATNLLSGNVQSCGCLKSKGELKISNILKDNNIRYIRQKEFDNCINPKTGAKLKFDFYLPDYNICIEYDGEQHFCYSNSGWNTEENHKKVVYSDSIKNKYCQNFNIKLIRISYIDYSKLDWNYLKNKINF